MRTSKQQTIIKPKKAVKRSLKDRLRFDRWQLAALILLVVVTVSWTLIAMGNSTLSVTTRTLSIPGLPSALEGYTIVQVSDLNGARFGDNQEKLVKSITSINYDALCMTGDMIGASGDAQPLYELVDGLNAQKSKPMLFITGDADPDPIESASGDDGNVYADYINQLIARGVTYLDSPYEVEKGDARVWFTSALHLNVNTSDYLDAAQQRCLNAMSQGDADTVQMEAYRLDCAQKLNTAAQSMQSTDVHIALSHTPLSDDFVRSLQYAEGDLSAESQDSSRSNQYSQTDRRGAVRALCGRTMACAFRGRNVCAGRATAARRLVPGSESGQGSAPLQFGLHIHDIGSGHFVGVPPAQFPTVQHARDSRDKADRQAGRIGGKNCQSTFYRIITARTKICCKI